MSFLHGSQAKVYVNGYDVTTYLTDFSPSISGEGVDVTTFGASWHDVIVGLRNFSFTANGFIDGAVGAQDEIINALTNVASSIWLYFPQGDTLGNFGYGLKGIQVTYTPTSSIGGASTFSLNTTGKGAADRVVSLHAKAAETATGNGASVDNGASSANGGAGYIEQFAYSGLTNVIYKIQHSVDDAIWVDLITFATITAANQKEQIAVTGTVERYVRGVRTVSGVGSSTFALAFGRR